MSVYYTLRTYWRICKSAKMSKETFSQMFYSEKNHVSVSENAMNVQINRLKNPQRNETLECYLVNHAAFMKGDEYKYSDVSSTVIGYAYRKFLEKPVGKRTVMELLYEMTKEILKYSSHALQCANQEELVLSVVNMEEKRYRSDDSLLDSSERENFSEICRNAVEVWYEKKKGSGRYRGYFYSKGRKEITRIKNKLLTNSGRELDLYKILFDYDGSNTHSVNLCGRGGSGKTFQILRCIEEILQSDENLLPFYIPLGNLNFDGNSACNSIISYLSDNTELENSGNTKKALSSYGTGVILFADGLNEISDPVSRRKTARDICEIRQNFGTRFVVSSRQDDTGMFGSLNYGEDKYFVKAQVLELDDGQIDEYLEKVNCSCRLDELQNGTKNLLRTPQGLVMYAELVGSILCPAENIDSLGKLIEKYCINILGTDNRYLLIRCEEVLGEIAYNMVLDETFVIDIVDIERFAGRNNFDMLFGENSPVRQIFVLNTSDEFTFTHQNYRDYYCAKYFANKLKRIKLSDFERELEDTFKVNNVTANSEILELVSAFTESSTNTVQKVVDIIRVKQKSLSGELYGRCSFALRVLIEIYAFSHGNCIAGLNLSGLDLTSVSLNGYRLISDDGRLSVNLDGSEIDPNTFLKTGLPTAAYAICKYTLNGRTYIGAFSRTTAMIADVEKNQIEMVRDLPDYGKVNCAVAVEYLGGICIFLGCMNNCTAIFYPSETGGEKRVFFDTGLKSRRGIESILDVTAGGIEYLVFCDSDGNIFVRELFPEPEKEKSVMTFSVGSFETRDSTEISCHCAYDRDSENVIIAFGNGLYSLDMNNLESGINPYNVSWRGLAPDFIEDIAVTKNYIFLNEGDIISIIYKNSPQRPKIREYIVDRERVINSRKERLKNNKEAEQVIRYEISHSQGYIGDTHDFCFTALSVVPDGFYSGEEAVLVGIRAFDTNLYRKIPNFFEIKIRSNDRTADTVNVVQISGEQKLATFRGVYYKLSSSEQTVRLAVTSEDRSVELIAPHNEEIAPRRFEGAYNGVRSIKFVSGGEDLICALYDGSVVHFSKGLSRLYYDGLGELDKPEYIVKDVVKVHDDWVWKALPFENSDGKLAGVISCSYDHTVKIFRFSEEKAETVIHGKQALIGLCLSEDGKEIWASSQNYIYFVNFADGVPKEQREFFTGDRKLRALVMKNSGSVYFFYNTGDNTQGYIAYIFSDGTVRNAIVCERGVFIRKIEFLTVNNYKYLVIGGSNENRAYIAVYREEPENKYSLISSCTVPEGTDVNDFLLTETADGLKAVIVCKNGLVGVLSADRDMNFSEVSNHVIISEQPLCIDKADGLILVGLLNGKIVKICTDGKNVLVSDFLTTHAGLMAGYSTDIRNCKIKNRKIFEKQMDNYFII